MDVQKVQMLIDIYDEYVKLFGEENSSLMGLAIAHGWNGNQEHYKRGKEIRADIKRLKSELGLRADIEEKDNG